MRPLIKLVSSEKYCSLKKYSRHVFSKSPQKMLYSSHRIWYIYIYIYWVVSNGVRISKTHCKISSKQIDKIINIYYKNCKFGTWLTHWGRMTHMCVGNLTIIGSDNGLSPGRRQAITWTNVGILLIGPLGTHFSEMLIEVHTFSFKKFHLKMSSGKWRPFFSASMC